MWHVHLHIMHQEQTPMPYAYILMHTLASATKHVSVIIQL